MDASLAPSPGRYDRYLTPAELTASQDFPWNDLTGEINVLRYAVDRFLDALRAASPTGVIEPTSADLRALATAFGILGSLVSFQLAGHAPLADLQADIDEAFRLSRIKLGLLPPDDPPPPPPPPDDAESQVPCPNDPLPAVAAAPIPAMPTPSATACIPPVTGSLGRNPSIRSP